MVLLSTSIPLVGVVHIEYNGGLTVEFTSKRKLKRIKEEYAERTRQAINDYIRGTPT